MGAARRRQLQEEGVSSAEGASGGAGGGEGGEGSATAEVESAGPETEAEEWALIIAYFLGESLDFFTQGQVLVTQVMNEIE